MITIKIKFLSLRVGFWAYQAKISRSGRVVPQSNSEKLWRTITLGLTLKKNYVLDVRRENFGCSLKQVVPSVQEQALHPPPPDKFIQLKKTASRRLHFESVSTKAQPSPVVKFYNSGLRKLNEKNRQLSGKNPLVTFLLYDPHL